VSNKYEFIVLHICIGAMPLNHRLLIRLYICR